MVISQAGAIGQRLEFHAYSCEKRVSPCALRVLWKRQDVKATIVQLMKNEELVMEMKQFSATVPPAVATCQCEFREDHSGTLTGEINICQDNR